MIRGWSAGTVFLALKGVITISRNSWHIEIVIKWLMRSNKQNNNPTIWSFREEIVRKWLDLSWGLKTVTKAKVVRMEESSQCRGADGMSRAQWLALWAGRGETGEWRPGGRLCCSPARPAPRADLKLQWGDLIYLCQSVDKGKLKVETMTGSLMVIKRRVQSTYFWLILKQFYF